MFQFESRGMRDILRKYQPTRIEDLCALNALYRPGPIQGGMIDDFIDRKHGRKQVTYDFPELKEILEETYGVIVYQEQVMQISNRLAGYSLGEADILRRAMGKKKAEEMAAQRERFLKGAKEKGLPQKKVEKIFDLMEQFAGYGFNKSHSAAYAYLAYVTAYLKAHYPLEFMSALLTSETGNTDKVVKYINECREMGIAVLPPDVNSSGRDFTPDGEGIRLGLGTINNVGASAAEAIIAARSKGAPFRSLYGFCERVDLTSVNRRVLENLIKCGAMSSLPGNRAQLTAAIDQRHGIRTARLEGPPERPDRPVRNGVGRARGSRTSAACSARLDHRQKLASEKEVLGIYVTGHPLDQYSDKVAELATLRHRNAGGPGERRRSGALRHPHRHPAASATGRQAVGRDAARRPYRAAWKRWSSPRSTTGCSPAWWRIRPCWCAAPCCPKTTRRPRSRSRTSCRWRWRA